MILFVLLFAYFGSKSSALIENQVYSTLLNQEITLKPNRNLNLNSIRWRLQRDGSNNDLDVPTKFKIDKANNLRINKIDFDDALNTFIYSTINSTSVDFQNYDPIEGFKFIVLNSKVDCTQSTLNRNYVELSPKAQNSTTLSCSIKVKKSANIVFKPVFTWYQNELGIDGRIRRVKINHSSINETIEKKLEKDFYLYTQKLNYNLPSDEHDAWKLNDQKVVCLVGHDHFFIQDNVYNSQEIKTLNCSLDLVTYHEPFIHRELINKIQISSANDTNGIFIECPIKIHPKDLNKYQLKWSLVRDFFDQEEILADYFMKSEFLTANTLKYEFCLHDSLYKCELVGGKYNLSSEIQFKLSNPNDTYSNIEQTIEFIDSLVAPDASYYVFIVLLILFIVLDVIVYQMDKKYFERNNEINTNNNNLNRNNNNSSSSMNIQFGRQIGVSFVKHKFECPLYRQNPAHFIPTLQIDED